MQILTPEARIVQKDFGRLEAKTSEIAVGVEGLWYRSVPMISEERHLRYDELAPNKDIRRSFQRQVNVCIYGVLSSRLAEGSCRVESSSIIPVVA